MKKRLRKKLSKRVAPPKPDLKEILEHYSTTEPLTLEAMQEYLMDIFNSREARQAIIVGQYCSTQGYVERGGGDLKLCDDPNCKSCSAILRELKNLIYRV